ncbi:MAG: hypothetical protein J3K34DRAFT_399209, partial [Monoraphidium minutum]
MRAAHIVLSMPLAAILAFSSAIRFLCSARTASTWLSDMGSHSEQPSSLEHGSRGAPGGGGAARADAAAQSATTAPSASSSAGRAMAGCLLI